MDEMPQNFSRMLDPKSALSFSGGSMFGMVLSYYPNPQFQPLLSLGSNGSLGRLVRERYVFSGKKFYVQHSETPGICRGFYMMLRVGGSVVTVQRIRDDVPLGKPLLFSMEEIDLVIVES